MRLRRAAIIAVLVCAAPAGAARDLCKMLKDKGVLNDIEYNECKAAQEKEEVSTETKTREILGTKLPVWLDKFTPFGDVRTRYEGFYEEGMKPLNRGRLRLRLGMKFTLNDEVSATARLASGNSDDPISSNQDFDKLFTGKPIHLDQAYITLTPGQTVGLTPGMITIMGGKMPVTTYKPSEMVWDEDVQPEGGSEIITFVNAKEGQLRNLRLDLFQWVLDSQGTNQIPYLLGGQFVTDLALTNQASWTLAFGDYHYEGLNALARKFLSPTITNSAGTMTSSNPNRNSSLANSNRVNRDNLGSITGFTSGYNIISGATEFSVVNPFQLGLPAAGVFGDYAYNTQADGQNQGFYIGAGVGSPGRGWYNMSLKNQGDWGASYTWAWVEKDAVFSTFSFSDLNYSVGSTAAANTQKGSSNVTGHILRLDYSPFGALQLTAKGIASSAVDRGAATTVTGAPLAKGGSPVLWRTQLDAMVRF